MGIMMEEHNHSLIPSFLLSSSSFSKSLLDMELLKARARKNSKTLLPSPNYNYDPSTSVPSASRVALSSRRGSFVIPAPSEPGKIAMFSPAYYAACTVGGTFCCGLTHMAITPLDLVKCNMQVHFPPSLYIRTCIHKHILVLVKCIHRRFVR